MKHVRQKQPDIMNTSIQIRVGTPLRDRLEDLRRSQHPRVPPLAELVRDLITKALDDPPTN